MTAVRLTINGCEAVADRGDDWEVRLGDASAHSSKLFEAVAAVMNATGLAVSTLVVVQAGLGWEDLEAELVHGMTVCIAGETSLFAVTDDGLDEIGPEEHPGWEEVGSYHGRPQLSDEADIDHDNFLVGWLGRIGSVYFDRQKDPWEIDFIGQMESDDDAIRYVCGADRFFER